MDKNVSTDFDIGYDHSWEEHDISFLNLMGDGFHVGVVEYKPDFPPMDQKTQILLGFIVPACV